jgi:methylated-DNA-[protein]-cysteine S-methyltransferase
VVLLNCVNAAGFGQLKEENIESLIFTCSLETPLGPMMVRAENEALTGLWFAGQKHYPSFCNTWIEAPDYPVFSQLRAWLRDYFQGTNRKPEIELEPCGTAFQQEVWRILIKIPLGQILTYGAIAREIGLLRGSTRLSAQAVGGAVAHNPISILIPCHRVIGQNGSLTGYAGGIDKKKALLKLEGVELKSF